MTDRPKERVAERVRRMFRRVASRGNWNEAHVRYILEALGSGGEEPCEMFLCEAENVVLKKDKLYRFREDPGCERCREIADEYRTPATETDRPKERVARERVMYRDEAREIAGAAGIDPFVLAGFLVAAVVISVCLGWFLRMLGVSL